MWETHTNKGATEIVRYRKPAISSGLNWSTPDGEACSACPPGSVWSIVSNKLKSVHTPQNQHRAFGFNSVTQTCGGVGPDGSCTIFIVTSVAWSKSFFSPRRPVSGHRCTLTPTHGDRFVTKTNQSLPLCAWKMLNTKKSLVTYLITCHHNQMKPALTQRIPSIFHPFWTIDLYCITK